MNGALEIECSVLSLLNLLLPGTEQQSNEHVFLMAP